MPKQATGIFDLVRFVRAIRSDSSISGFLDQVDLTRLSELVVAVRELVDAYSAIEVASQDSSARFLDALIDVTRIASEATNWTADDRIARAIEVVAGEGPIRDWALHWVATFFVSVTPLTDVNACAALNIPASAAITAAEESSWHDWIELARFLVSIWRSL